jgi:hypothetical protein
MDSRDLTRRQLDSISAQLRPMLVYLRKLDNRMQAQAFPPDDEMFAATKEAYAAVHKLSVRTHYLRCGVGLTSEERAKRKPQS